MALKSLHEAKAAPFIFPSMTQPHKKHVSNMAMAMCLRRMEYGDYTVRGFRSSFLDWAGETTSFPNDVCEQALAHEIEDEAERAYRRGDMLTKRAKLMEAWAQYCEPRRKLGAAN